MAKPIEHRAEATALHADGKLLADATDNEKLSIEASPSTLEDLFHKGVLTGNEYRRHRLEIVGRL